MTKVRFLALALLLLAISAALLWWYRATPSPSQVPAVAASATRPNIILIIADDIGWKDYGFNGHPVLQTPHLDRLAQQGVVFDRGYTVNAICRPSLASMISGRYPYQHGITVNGRAINAKRGNLEWGHTPFSKRMSELQTLPRVLSGLGYRSLQTGKWWEEGFANGGFDEGDKKPEGLLGHVTRANTIGRAGLDPIYEFIDRQEDRPFFIWYAPQMPHTPHKAPADFMALYAGKAPDENTAKYWAMVSWFDQTVGDLMNYLDKKHLQDNTLVIYLADNGVIKAGENTAERGKDSPYEAGIRSPIIFHWPARWPAAQRNELASSIDIFPTLLEILQQPTGDLPGASLLPTIQGTGTLQRNAVAGEGYTDHGERLDNPRAFRWLRSGDWKLIEYTNGTVELYDVSRDPDERNNLAGLPGEVQRQLQQQMDQMLPP